MEEKEAEVVEVHSTPPAVIANQAKKHRFAKIFFSVTIACSFLILFSLLSTIVTPIMYIFAVVLLFGICIVMVVGTLGAACIYWGNPAGKVWSLLGTVLKSGENMMDIVVFCFSLAQWFSIAGIIFSVGAIVFLSISKSKFKVAKIVCASVLLVLFVLVLTFYLITGGALWQS